MKLVKSNIRERSEQSDRTWYRRRTIAWEHVCVRGCACVCVCVYECDCSRRAAKLGLNVYSVTVCLCLCVRMYHRRSSISAFEMESKGLSKCHVELCQCELHMRVRQVGCDQGSCDVDGGRCVHASDFVRVYACVCLWLWLLNDERWGCVRGYAPINKLWTMRSVIGVVHCG